MFQRCVETTLERCNTNDEEIAVKQLLRGADVRWLERYKSIPQMVVSLMVIHHRIESVKNHQN